MPGPFTHIYTARRVAEFLQCKDVTDGFIRLNDGKLLDEQQLLPDLLRQVGRSQCAKAMTDWQKFAAVGAIGPDIFFWLEDYNDISIHSDEIMLAMSLLYYLDDQGRLPDPYSGLLTIFEKVSDTWASILRFIIKLDQLWQDFLKVWNATIGPILDKAGQVVDDLTGGLFSALGDAFTQLKNGLLALVEEEIFTEGDIFGWFSLKMRKGFDEQAFLWSDMTHYRRTSLVPAQMIVRARKMMQSDDALTKEHGEQLLAFALGWICHVGTDVIEHSFVNEQCGGPFRTHWQRHHLIENHIDAWNYQCTGNGTLPVDDFVGWQESYKSLPDSALYFALQIPQNIDTFPIGDPRKQGVLRQPLPEGTDQATQDERKKLLDTDGALPLWLAEMIVEVFIDVYADPDTEGGSHTVQDPLHEKDANVQHPQNLGGQDYQDKLKAGPDVIGTWLGLLGVDNVGIALDELRKIIAPDPPVTIPHGFPMPWQVQTAYRFMLSWFKRQYVNTMDMDRPEPPTVFTPPSSDYATGPPDFSGVNPSDDPISQVCEALAAVLDWVFKSLEQAAQFAYDIVKTIASAATWPAREALYEGVTLPLWEATENIRMVLVHLGYMMPQSEQSYDDGTGNLKRPNEIDEALIKLGHTVDSAFQEALAAALDPLGNLDKDPALTNVGLRKVIGADNPWLPVRTTRGQKPPWIPSLQKDDVVEYQRPWGFPDRTNDQNAANAGNYLEAPLTTAGPYATDTMPDHLLRTDQNISNTARKLYQDAGCPCDTDLYSKAFVQHALDNRFDEGRFQGTNPLGDPVVFSTYLIGQIACNPNFASNFNLDADRGYGYLCWDWVRGDMPAKDPPLDAHLHAFRPPLTWPEGAGDTHNLLWPRPAPAPVPVPPKQNLYLYQDGQGLQLWYQGRAPVEGECKPKDNGGNDGPPR